MPWSRWTLARRTFQGCSEEDQFCAKWNVPFPQPPDEPVPAGETPRGSGMMGISPEGGPQG